MIRYRLTCDRGHEFEAWFHNSAAYDAQTARNQIQCPECGSVEIGKTLMTPNIAPGRNAVAESPEDARAKRQAAAAVAHEIREHVEANADYVGDRFAEEARKIHYEEVEPRGIYGEATAEEASDLREEGVEVHPLPPSAKEQN